MFSSAIAGNWLHICVNRKYSFPFSAFMHADVTYLMLHLLAPPWFGLCFPAMKGGRYKYYAFQTWQYKTCSIFWIWTVYASLWRRNYLQQINLYHFRGFSWTGLEFGNTKKKTLCEEVPESKVIEDERWHHCICTMRWHSYERQRAW
jgi:hypothetical protein